MNDFSHFWEFFLSTFSTGRLLFSTELRQTQSSPRLPNHASWTTVSVGCLESREDEPLVILHPFVKLFSYLSNYKCLGKVNKALFAETKHTCLGYPSCHL